MSEQKDKGTLHLFATLAALTERGGRVSTTSEFKLCGLGVARVGDVVTYPDGSEAIIVDGAGYGCVTDNRAAALVAQKTRNPSPFPRPLARKLASMTSSSPFAMQRAVPCAKRITRSACRPVLLSMA